MATKPTPRQAATERREDARDFKTSGQTRKAFNTQDKREDAPRPPAGKSRK